nr:zinc finger protein 644-like [Labrus bergylta]
MAAEMSCLTGVDDEDKDAEPEINAFTLLQEPVRMAQEEATCTDSFSKPSSKQNSVLDVLSNTDMLSSVGLGNGPSSHQATQAHELNSISTEKDEAKSITPLKTVQEIDTAGIWGFDEDSPENSLDNFSGASDLHWDPHKEFMQFLWDSHGDSPGEESKDEVPSVTNRGRRKRKMDMVVMVDPSEDLYPDLSPKSSEELSDAECQEDSIPVSKVKRSRKLLKSQLSPTEKVSKYPNGTVKAIKDILYNGPARNAHENKNLDKRSNVSKRASSPSESSDISDLFKNSKIRRSLKSQITESKLDKSINVLLSRQRHGRKTAEQKKESNNCSTSVQNSKIDKDSSDHLPETLTVKVEEPALTPKCHRVPSSATKSDLNCSSVPTLKEDQSTVKKSPSKRKMSTPYRNTSDQDSCFILQKPSPKKINLEEEEESDYDEKDIFQFQETDAIPNRFDNDIKREKPNIIYTYSRRMSMRGALQASKRLFEKIKTEEQDEQDGPEIKEEEEEIEVFQENFETHQIPLSESFTEDVSDLESERKNCPYCPAIFESGVGLSNHVRGHLHRVGLNYDARHVVPPEQVASHDRRPRIRRKISALRRLKKALRMESEPETVKSIHSCPLCGDSFDNRTGQSNHIRGHLKKLGKSFSKKNKSPLYLLRELMRDKKEFQRALQILGKRRNHFQYGASPKLSGVDCYRQQPSGIPKRSSIPSDGTETGSQIHAFSLAEMKPEKRQLETKLDVKNSLSGATALIGILKKRKCQEDARLKGSSQMSRNTLAVSTNGEHCPGSRVASSLPKSISEKGEFNRKVCVHCNATFHSGVSLSNHLRAYAKRKRTAIEDGTTLDCKIRRQRSRPGPKKKSLPLPQTPEEMYRLTCRFCDLVFQGPLSVQEDWIKHLQRHIMNTSVPHTGLGMVEVTSLPKTLKTDQDSSLTATNAAS